MGQLKARIRAEVFNALDDQSEPRPPLSHENLLINELIREYLEFNKYRYTASVLTAGKLALYSLHTIEWNKRCPPTFVCVGPAGNDMATEVIA